MQRITMRQLLAWALVVNLLAAYSSKMVHSKHEVPFAMAFVLFPAAVSLAALYFSRRLMVMCISLIVSIGVYYAGVFVWLAISIKVGRLLW